MTNEQIRALLDRQRKYYKLTRKGAQLLSEKRVEWEAFHHGVNSVLAFGASYA